MRYPFRGLRFRLAAVYLAWFGSLLAAGAASLYVALDGGARAQIDRTLQETVLAARDIYTRDRPEFPEEEMAVAHIVAELIYGDRAMIAYGPDGRELGRSRRFPGAPDLQSLGSQRVPRPATVATPTGSARVLSGELQAGIHVLVGVSRASLEQQRRTLQLVLLAGLPLLLVASAGVGVLAAGPALRPISAVAEAAERTEALIAGGRRDFPPIPNRVIPDEVGTLTASFNRLLARLGEAFGRERLAAARQLAFLSDAAHELRTPTAIVMSEAESLLTSAPRNTADTESLGIIVGEARRMGDVIGDLLLMARGEAAAEYEAGELLFLDDITSTVMIRARRTPLGRDRVFRIGHFETAPIFANQVLIERAIMVLLDNALVHAPNSPVEISVGTDQEWAWLRIRDWGPGVPPTDGGRIFERFARGRTSAAGSGLGLSIARWIAERMNGRLRHEAPADGGAAFVMEFPIRR
ncbi:MAG: HAMP domain-containing histidine kinase [Gemmatimonadales bacterium]|nr:HAMP domain-containing histidine kinase [Gemmatimonadales bacterium]